MKGILKLRPPNPRKKVINWDAVKFNIQRAGLTANPLSCYNPTSSNPLQVLNNNELVKYGDYAYAGDTIELIYDFYTKIAGSIAECPMKIYRCHMTELQPPSNITSNYLTGFQEYDSTNQSVIDYFRSQDNNAYTAQSPLTSGLVVQFMVEVDFWPIVNSLFGGNVAAFRSALKSPLIFDVWAKGSGSNGGVLTNGAYLKLWNGNAWSTTVVGINTTSSLSKMSVTRTDYMSSFITADSKLYAIIYSVFPCDGSIASSLSLDYVKATINLTKVAETVIPQKANLPKYWAVTGSISPCYDSSKISEVDRFFAFYRDINNMFQFVRNVESRFIVYSSKDGTTKEWAQTSPQTFNKNQVYRYLITKTKNAVILYILKNNSVVEKVMSTDIADYKGLFQVDFLNRNNVGHADAFADRFKLIDLQAIGKSDGFTDLEAVSILKGGRSNNLIDAATSTLNKYVNQSSPGNLVDSSVSDSSDYIHIKGNTAYTVSGANNQTAQVMAWYDSGKNFISSTSSVNGIKTSPANAVYCRIAYNDLDKNTIQLEEGSSASPYAPYKFNNSLNIEERELFEISKVALHTNATREGQTITLNADGSGQGSTISIPVLPNNRYELKSTLQGVSGGGYVGLNVMYRYNNISLGGGFVNSATTGNTSTNSAILITPANCNNIQIILQNGVSIESGKFSDISLKLKM